MLQQHCSKKENMILFDSLTNHMVFRLATSRSQISQHQLRSIHLDLSKIYQATLSKCHSHLVIFTNTQNHICTNTWNNNNKERIKYRGCILHRLVPKSLDHEDLHSHNKQLEICFPNVNQKQYHRSPPPRLNTEKQCDADNAKVVNTHATTTMTSTTCDSFHFPLYKGEDIHLMCISSMNWYWIDAVVLDLTTCATVAKWAHLLPPGF